MNPYSNNLDREARAGIPFSRVLIRNGRLYFSEWLPSMIVLQTEYPMYEALACKGVKIVDVSREVNAGVREFFAVPVRGHELEAADIDLLVAFAEQTGYHRAWIGTSYRFFDLPGVVPFGAVASVTCDHCGWHIEDSGATIWDFVARNNAFPSRCFACGQGTATWDVAAASGDESAASDLSEEVRGGTWTLGSQLCLRSATVAADPADIVETGGHQALETSRSFDQEDLFDGQEWFGDEPPSEYDV